MNDPTPHYLLTTEAGRIEGSGDWRFALRPADGSAAIEVVDVEPDVWGERLELLTVVRALESLDQPSRVTLIGTTRYVEQGILYGLAEWRENEWRWERFGQMTPVRDTDLWQRMDRILQFHRVECGQRRFDAAHGLLAGRHQSNVTTDRNWVNRLATAEWVKYSVPAVTAWCAAWMETASRVWQTGVRMAAGCCSLFLLHRS